MFDDWFDSKKKEEKEEREVDMYPHLTILIPAARELLRDKQSVSLPELQMHFGISFSDVKAFVEILKQNGIIIGKIDGLSYKTNSRIIVCTDLEYDDILYIAAALSKKDIATLSGFKSGSGATPARLGACDNLIKEGVIFEMEGNLYLSYGKPTVDALVGLKFSEEEWLIEKTVAECLDAALKGIDVLAALEDVHMIPPQIASAVRERLPEVEKSGKAPRPVRRVMNLDSMKFGVIENTIRHYCFEDVESYLEAVRAEISKLREAGLEDTDMLAVMNIALGEIETLSIESIKEIKNMLDDTIDI